MRCAAPKTSGGNFFEDFYPGQQFSHAAPRTLTYGDQAVYTALYGSRFALQSSDHFARDAGFPRSPLDDLLVFNVIFGKTVPDISLNAVANLGYADTRFLAAVYPGDSLFAATEVIGVKENSNHQTGVVYARSRGYNQHGACVLHFIRWVMVRKRSPGSAAPQELVPVLPKVCPPDELGRACPQLNPEGYDRLLAGSPHVWDDYETGERIDHADGVTVEDAEHQMATRLYQNTARVHFNQFSESKGRFGRRLVYGGHVMSLARALSFNGLANAFQIAAINGGRHVAPLFAGQTVFAWSEVIERAEIPGRSDIGALRLRTVAAKDRECADFPRPDGGAPDPAVILDLDYWALMPR